MARVACSLFLLNVLLNTKQLTNHSGPFKISFVADGHSTVFMVKKFLFVCGPHASSASHHALWVLQLP